MTFKPCPYCACKTINRKSSKDDVRIVCSACGAEGPSAKTDDMAKILWNRRPDTDFWKQVAAYLGSIHGANVSDYMAKSVSKSRRDRQISILKTVANALLRGQDPEGRPRNDPDKNVAWAGERAEKEMKRLEDIQKELEK
jgi:Lar family restriction alleviation protein